MARNHVRFVDRSMGQCAYPLDDNIGADMQCCGAPVRDIGGVYCDEHCAICFGATLAPVSVNPEPEPEFDKSTFRGAVGLSSREQRSA